MIIRPRPESFWHHIRDVRFWVVLLALVAFSKFLEKTEVVSRASFGALDSFGRFVPDDSAGHTSLIGMWPADLEAEFGGRRPLPPERLVAIVDTLLLLQPAVLVVDVFTESSEYARLDVPDSPTTQVVWARELDATGAPRPVLGGRTDTPLSSGIAEVPIDRDWMTRSALPAIAVSATPGWMASLALAAAHARCASNDADTCAELAEVDPGDDHWNHAFYVRAFERDQAVYRLGDVLALLRQGQVSDQFRNRILVFGFFDGSDVVPTPQGEVAGSLFLADAIETLLDARALMREAPHAISLPLKILIALLIAFVHYKLVPRVAAVSMLALVVGTMAASALIYVKLGWWTSFVPLIVGVWIEQLYHDIAHAGEHEHEKAPHVPPVAPVANVGSTEGT